MYTDN